MSFHVTRAGRAYLLEWESAMLVEDILAALVELRHARAVGDPPMVLIILLRLSVPFPSRVVRESLQAALPAMFASTVHLLIAVEGSGDEREVMRTSLWTMPPNSTIRTALISFSSLDQALVHARCLAPKDVLNLQRIVLGGRAPR